MGKLGLRLPPLGLEDFPRVHVKVCALVSGIFHRDYAHCWIFQLRVAEVGPALVSSFFLAGEC